ncbi:MAG: glycosyl hydrolase [Planctomycetota bacterium]
MNGSRLLPLYRVSMQSVIVGFAAIAISALPLCAAEPADPQLIPEGRAVLDYLHSIYGKQCLAGQFQLDRAETIFKLCGKYPAIVSFDLAPFTNFDGNRWSPEYQEVLQRHIDEAKQWHERGGIVTLQWHWLNPLSDEGNVKAVRPDFLPVDVGKVVTPGTPEHQAAIEDIRRHADYLEQLAKARVPVLFRPLHEIDGGWFWWSDTQRPENTAALWRMIFDEMVHRRGLHNLIWVYSAALKTGLKGKDVEQIDQRKRFYPGDQYVDISGIDIYVNSWFGWADFRESSYPKAFEIMRQVTPNKILALCECQGIPDPERMHREGPRWLYCLPWTVDEKDGGKWNPADWIRRTYAHDLMITLDELPAPSGTERSEALR